MEEKTKLIKIGGSHGLVIPMYMLKVLGLEKGDDLKVELKNNKIVVVEKQEGR